MSQTYDHNKEVTLTIKVENSYEYWRLIDVATRNGFIGKLEILKQDNTIPWDVAYYDSKKKLSYYEGLIKS